MGLRTRLDRLARAVPLDEDGEDEAMIARRQAALAQVSDEDLICLIETARNGGEPPTPAHEAAEERYLALLDGIDTRSQQAEYDFAQRLMGVARPLEL